MDIAQKISPSKDVDGFHPVNVGKLALNKDTFVSCTPFGIMKMFEEYNIDLTGKDVVNPIATILSGAMMLKYSFKMDEAYNKIEKAIKDVLAEGYRTQDIKQHDTKIVGTTYDGLEIVIMEHGDFVV